VHEVQDLHVLLMLSGPWPRVNEREKEDDVETVCRLTGPGP
jgi:hypothetical protein